MKALALDAVLFRDVIQRVAREQTRRGTYAGGDLTP